MPMMNLLSHYLDNVLADIPEVDLLCGYLIDASVDDPVSLGDRAIQGKL